MRIAVPICRGRVSPVFDVARRYRVFDINDGEITDQAEHVVCGEPWRELMKLAVDRVICAGITRELRLCLGGHGIEVLAGFCGALDEVIDAYARGRLGCGDFNMPGWAGKDEPFRQTGERKVQAHGRKERTITARH